MGRVVPARDAATLTGSIKSKIMDIFKERLADWGKGNWQLFKYQSFDILKEQDDELTNHIQSFMDSENIKEYIRNYEEKAKLLQEDLLLAKKQVEEETKSKRQQKELMVKEKELNSFRKTRSNEEYKEKTDAKSGLKRTSKNHQSNQLAEENPLLLLANNPLSSQEICTSQPPPTKKQKSVKLTEIQRAAKIREQLDSQMNSARIKIQNWQKEYMNNQSTGKIFPSFKFESRKPDNMEIILEKFLLSIIYSTSDGNIELLDQPRFDTPLGHTNSINIKVYSEANP